MQTSLEFIYITTTKNRIYNKIKKNNKKKRRDILNNNNNVN
jgi:hypothetical protein